MSKHCLTALLISLSILISANVPDSCGFCGSQKKTPLYLFTAGYRMPLNKSTIINSGHGIYLEAGINVGKLVSKKTVIGIYGGWAWRDVFWSTSFNQAFLKDYHAAVDRDDGLSSLDSSIISTSSELMHNKKGNSLTMPGCETNSFKNYSLYYGIVINLPCRFVPAVKVYTGFVRSHFQGQAGLVTKNSSYSIFQLRRAMYGAELILFKGIQKSENRNMGTFGIYYEYYDFSNASLYFDDGNKTRSISLKNFAASSFLKKYGKESAWGIKISFTIL
jgi:hypothetical protein